MCALFTLKKNPGNLEILGNFYDFSNLTWEEKILPGRYCPVLVKDSVKLMRFSLIPSWSKESKVKFATHNARIETVLEKPTWRKPFEKNHCLIPMDGFIEPIYEGEHAGHMIRFGSQKLLFAAGIYDEWINKETGEVLESFSILTKAPTEFVLKTGHDRQPIFLKQDSDRLNWLNIGALVPGQWQKFLDNVENENTFELEVDRALKSVK